MFKVVKRDGEVAEFDIAKSGGAISKAFDATKKHYNQDMTELLSLRVTSDFQSKIKDGRIDVESIQDSVENTLVQAAMGCGQGLYSLPEAAGEDSEYEVHHPGL